jgi:hypothetical protein
LVDKYTMTTSAQYNKELSVQKTNEFLKDNLGINKTLDKMYEEYTSNKKTKDMKILKEYLKDKLAGHSPNPYHIYNQFYYYNGIP